MKRSVLLAATELAWACFTCASGGVADGDAVKVTVKRGVIVKQGVVIGQIGNSGDSLFPHLHYELRTGLGTKDVERLGVRVER